jgi:hypothetical protein
MKNHIINLIMFYLSCFLVAIIGCESSNGNSNKEEIEAIKTNEDKLTIKLFELIKQINPNLDEIKKVRETLALKTTKLLYQMG